MHILKMTEGGVGRGGTEIQGFRRGDVSLSLRRVYDGRGVQARIGVKPHQATLRIDLGPGGTVQTS